MEYPSLLTFREVAGVKAFIVLVYFGLFMGGLYLVATHLSQLPAGADVWGGVNGHWDHPEPNYAIVPSVAEFYAVATALPLAGGLLLYQGLRFDYNFKVVLLYMMDCWMYTCAFFSHMTLWPLLNCVTLTSVMTNSLYTFSQYSHLAGGPLQLKAVRYAVTAALWLGVVYMVKFLPDLFGEKGGVPALLTIQTPAVISAMLGAFYVARNMTKAEHAEIFDILKLSGILLVTAMAVSLVEVIFGQYCQDRYFGNFPLFHVVIHSLEQVGIYLYGVGVAGIEHRLVRDIPGARIEFLGGWLPYLAITSRLPKKQD
jgi:hypothetical protein